MISRNTLVKHMIASVFVFVSLLQAANSADAQIVSNASLSFTDFAVTSSHPEVLSLEGDARIVETGLFPEDLGQMVLLQPFSDLTVGIFFKDPSQRLLIRFDAVGLPGQNGQIFVRVGDHREVLEQPMPFEVKSFVVTPQIGDLLGDVGLRVGVFEGSVAITGFEVEYTIPEPLSEDDEQWKTPEGASKLLSVLSSRFSQERKRLAASLLARHSKEALDEGGLEDLKAAFPEQDDVEVISSLINLVGSFETPDPNWRELLVDAYDQFSDKGLRHADFDIISSTLFKLGAWEADVEKDVFLRSMRAEAAASSLFSAILEKQPGQLQWPPELLQALSDLQEENLVAGYNPYSMAQSNDASSTMLTRETGWGLLIGAGTLKKTTRSELLARVDNLGLAFLDEYVKLKGSESFGEATKAWVSNRSQFFVDVLAARAIEGQFLADHDALALLADPLLKEKSNALWPQLFSWLKLSAPDLPAEEMRLTSEILADLSPPKNAIGALDIPKVVEILRTNLDERPCRWGEETKEFCEALRDVSHLSINEVTQPYFSIDGADNDFVTKALLETSASEEIDSELARIALDEGAGNFTRYIAVRLIVNAERQGGANALLELARIQAESIDGKSFKELQYFEGDSSWENNERARNRDQIRQARVRIDEYLEQARQINQGRQTLFEDTLEAAKSFSSRYASLPFWTLLARSGANEDLVFEQILEALDVADLRTQELIIDRADSNSVLNTREIPDLREIYGGTFDVYTGAYVHAALLLLEMREEFYVEHAVELREAFSLHYQILEEVAEKNEASLVSPRRCGSEVCSWEWQATFDDDGDIKLALEDGEDCTKDGVDCSVFEYGHLVSASWCGDVWDCEVGEAAQRLFAFPACWSITSRALALPLALKSGDRDWARNLLPVSRTFEDAWSEHRATSGSYWSFKTQNGKTRPIKKCGAMFEEVFPGVEVNRQIYSVGDNFDWETYRLFRSRALNLLNDDEEGWSELETPLAAELLADALPLKLERAKDKKAAILMAIAEGNSGTGGEYFFERIADYEERTGTRFPADQELTDALKQASRYDFDGCFDNAWRTDCNNPPSDDYVVWMREVGDLQVVGYYLSGRRCCDSGQVDFITTKDSTFAAFDLVVGRAVDLLATPNRFSEGLTIESRAKVVKWLRNHIDLAVADIDEKIEDARGNQDLTTLYRRLRSELEG